MTGYVGISEAGILVLGGIECGLGWCGCSGVSGLKCDRTIILLFLFTSSTSLLTSLITFLQFLSSMLSNEQMVLWSARKAMADSFGVPTVAI